MSSFFEGRIKLVRHLLADDPDVAYADLVLILTAVLSACAAARWPRQKGDRIDKERFVELLVTASPPEARAAYISVPALITSGLITEDQTPWGKPGKSIRVYRGDEIDFDLNSATQAFPSVPKKKLKQHSYACLIYEWLRCGYAHEYCAGKWHIEVPPSREKTPVSYIGRLMPHGIVRMSCFHLDYLIDLADHHVKTLPNHALTRPNEWWLNVA